MQEGYSSLTLFSPSEYRRQNSHVKNAFLVPGEKEHSMGSQS